MSHDAPLVVGQHNTANRFGRRRKAIFSAFGVWLVLVMCVALLTQFWAAQTYRERANVRLNELSFRLEIELDRYRSLPKVLSIHPLVATALTDSEEDEVETLNNLLSDYNREISGEAVYAIDRDGIAIASSNWQAQDSFVGVDYRFRPYFQQALLGQDGSYFALGTVSNTRGYYFSHPIFSNDSEDDFENGAVVGALVIKVALNAIEKNLLDKDFDYVLTDVNGVIFFSSYIPWNYHSLSLLPSEITEELIQQRQFGDNTLPALTAEDSFETVLNEASIQLYKNNKAISFFTINRGMSEAGWRLIALAPTQLITDSVILAVLLFTVFYIFIYLMYFSWRRTIEARRELAAINEKLEHRVDERTIELRESNAQLREIIEKHQRTETTLKQTQSELIQAGKLAMLGEMSAGINHELNQPLAAMQIYIENIQTLTQRGDLNAVSNGATELLKLNKMLAKIAGQYKIFSRKATGKIGPVCLAQIVSESIAILDNKLAKAAIEFEVDDIDPKLQVMADPIPLEQTIINLLNNAIQAVSARPSPCVRLSISFTVDRVRIDVSDNGPGIEEQELKRLFEPFFTTKGTGLGLGLTISKRIVESYDGTIVASNRPEGGASFCVTLPRHFETRAVIQRPE